MYRKSTGFEAPSKLMPRPRAVEFHARRYKKKKAQLSKMPRPCAVESHARRYKKRHNSRRCHGLAPWSLTLAPTKKRHNSRRCHGLAPWSLTLEVFGNELQSFSNKRESPRRKAGASANFVNVLL